MRGIIGFGTYVPYYRLDGSAIAAALGGGGGRGSRSVAGFDEDATTMGVEAARAMFASAELPRPQTITFATTTPPYLDKTNANAIHAALNMPSDVFASDAAGSPRSTFGALQSALEGRRLSLLVSADVRTGRPQSADEAAHGDAGVALLIGDDDDAPVLAEPLGGASATAEFLDRWRLPAWNYSRVWEERFGESVYLPLVTEAATAGFKDSNLSEDDVDIAIITGLHARAVRGAATAAGLTDTPIAADPAPEIGNSGGPHPLVVLASVLDDAKPGQVIMVINLADGCDVMFLRTTDAIASWSSQRPVADQIAAGNHELDYNKFLTWRGFLDREPPRRPDPVPPAAPPSYRFDSWKFGFVGSRDRESGAVHLPPQRVSVKGGNVDDMEMVPMADVPATVATFTVDRLAYSLSPPTIGVVVDFDGGGRFTCQLADANADEVAIGMRVQMTFRRIGTANGIHNYFWKAKPVR